MSKAVLLKAVSQVWLFKARVYPSLNTTYAATPPSLPSDPPRPFFHPKDGSSSPPSFFLTRLLSLCYLCCEFIVFLKEMYCAVNS